MSPFTFQLRQLDRLGAAEGLSEIRVRIFFDQCAKFGGKLWDHKIVECPPGQRGRDSSENTVTQVRIGCCRRDMWHNFCNRVQGYKDGRLASFRARTSRSFAVRALADHPFHEFFHQHPG